jgi:FlaA1/EpsC-like NDP-sugar epimerase
VRFKKAILMFPYIKILLDLHRKVKILLQILIDVVLIAISFISACYLNLDNFTILNSTLFWVVIFINIIFTIVAFNFLRLYKALIRYVARDTLITIFKGAIISAFTLYVLTNISAIKISNLVIITYALFLFLMIGSVRFGISKIFRNSNQIKKRSVIIYGAGEAGLELLNSLNHGRDYLPVAFVDDDKSLCGLIIRGLKVYPATEISKLIKDFNIKEILLAIPSLSHTKRQKILTGLENYQSKVKIIPSVKEIINGSAKISELRKVSAEDLLGRDPVTPDQGLLSYNILDKVVMVTGAGGSIGSELCRQILKQKPSCLVLFDVSEFALYKIEAELFKITNVQINPVNIIPILGCVQNIPLLERIISAYKVQTIYHTAAYKHVPLVEENIVEGIRNNVFGTLAISNAAKKLEVESFTFISTDKAVRPTNVMGATKRLSELICQAYASDLSSTVFSMVRFGNVLGSSGSVIPRFLEQIEAGGPVTVTHLNINRYFMTIPEASQLVIQAGAMAKGGDVFILDMGSSVKIIDLAMSMIKLHGLVPYVVEHLDQFFPEKGDIPVCITGLRKGEKLYEELLIGNNPMPTQNSRIMTASELCLSLKELNQYIDRLKEACDTFNIKLIISILKELPLAYEPNGEEISDLLWKSENIL